MFKYNWNFLDQPLLPYKFHGSDMTGILLFFFFFFSFSFFFFFFLLFLFLFFLFASCEVLKKVFCAWDRLNWAEKMAVFLLCLIFVFSLLKCMDSDSTIEVEFWFGGKLKCVWKILNQKHFVPETCSIVLCVILDISVVLIIQLKALTQIMTITHILEKSYRSKQAPVRW